MKTYDVVITGAGPAGLMCAETLSGSGLSVLLLEKNDVFGKKVCAGGLTRKDIALLDVPDKIIEHKVNKTAVYTTKKQSGADAPEPFLFTVNRIELGTWHKQRLEKTDVEIRNKAKVTSVDDKKVVINNSEEIGYKYLVGADGFFSVVRKYLGLPHEKKLAGLQYIVPDDDPDPRLCIYLNSKRFHSWYGWKFPHKNSYAIGCCADPRILPPDKLKKNFKLWIKENGFDISNAEYQAYPISYDYRGYKFGNIFLTGEAAGLVSGFTGEGIYQSLVSGKTVANTILNPDHHSDEMDAVLKYNEIQEKILKFLIKAGPFRSSLHNLIVSLLNNKRIKTKIHRSFS